MSKESAKKLIAELQTNEELKAKIAGITDIAELTKKAVEAGYDGSLSKPKKSSEKHRLQRQTKSCHWMTLKRLRAENAGQARMPPTVMRWAV